MPSAPLSVGFTGHRRVADPAGVRAAIDRALLKLFVEAVLARGLAWTLLLPLALEEFRNDFGRADWERVQPLLPRAVRTHVEPPQRTREDAYLACGLRTVDESDAVIAFWNGRAAAGRGGTAEIVAYIRQRQKPLLWIHADTAAIAEERLESLSAARPLRP
jgi:hypothetical protein